MIRKKYFQNSIEYDILVQVEIILGGKNYEAY